MPWTFTHAEESHTESKTDNNIINLLDEPRDYLSDNLLDFSDRIDQIFSNTENFSSNNNSYARLSIASIWLDEDRPFPLTDAYIFFALPRTQDRLSILFQTDESEESDSGGTNLLPGSPSQKSSALAVRGKIVSGSNWSVSTDIGTKLNTVLDPFLRVSYRQKNKFKNWSLLWRESVYRFAYQGKGIDSQVRGDYPISDQFHLRLNNNVSWFEQESFYNRSHDLGLYQKLTDQNAISYSVGYYTVDDPQDNIYYTQIRYKSLLHDTWLYYEIIPEYIYPKSTGFTATPKFTLKLEMLLGNP